MCNIHGGSASVQSVILLRIQSSSF